MKIITNVKKIFTNIKKVYFGVLDFFGLIDEKRQLSRTNVLLYIFCYKFMTTPLVATNITELVGAIVALGGVGGAMGLYAYKKKLISNAEPIVDSVMDKLRTKDEDPTKE